MSADVPAADRRSAIISPARRPRRRYRNDSDPPNSNPQKAPDFVNSDAHYHLHLQAESVGWKS